MATKARMIALGQDMDGSFYIDDNRNIFLNPAAINDLRNSVILEMGDDGDSAASPNDKDNNPNAEGGFTQKEGNATYGLFLGKESNKASEVRFSGLIAGDGTNGATKYFPQDNVIHAFYGKKNDSSSWGSYAMFTESRDQTNNKSQMSAQVGFGQKFITSEWFAIMSLAGGMKVDQHEFEGKFGGKAGYIKEIANHKLMLQVSQIDFKINGAAFNPDVSLTDIDVRFAREKAIGQNSTLWLSMEINYDMVKVKNGDPTGLGILKKGKDNTTITIPIVISIESKVKEWLTLRGSVRQNIWGQEERDNKVSSKTNSTNINAGASLNFGDFTLDGLIGTGTNTAGSTIVDSNNEVGVLSGDSVFTRLALTYSY